ncbi:SRR1-like protein isoform X3 [Nyctibius grandis]|uniref:SRR1-like protein isoform X3 n=1 Tax=Nyctibius grandis TaxID=48427 RepID=UPI0035BC728B
MEAAGGWRPGRSAELRLLGGERRCVRGAGGSGAAPPGLTPLSVPAGAVRAPLAGSAEPPARCVCYGLGRFGGCPAARYQLAFLLLLLEELGVPPGRCSLFDPAFSAREVAALRQLGLRLLPDNEEGKHGVEGSATLFYMVHCGKALYNNLLWRNWSAGALSKMVIIGNSFKGIEERSALSNAGYLVLFQSAVKNTAERLLLHSKGLERNRGSGAPRSPSVPGHL